MSLCVSIHKHKRVTRHHYKNAFNSRSHQKSSTKLEAFGIHGNTLHCQQYFSQAHQLLNISHYV